MQKVDLLVRERALFGHEAADREPTKYFFESLPDEVVYKKYTHNSVFGKSALMFIKYVKQ